MMPWFNHTPPELQNIGSYGITVSSCNALRIESPVGEKLAHLFEMAGVPKYVAIDRKFIEECQAAGAYEIDALKIVDKKGKTLFEIALPPSDKVCEP